MSRRLRIARFRREVDYDKYLDYVTDFQVSGWITKYLSKLSRVMFNADHKAAIAIGATDTQIAFPRDYRGAQDAALIAFSAGRSADWLNGLFDPYNSCYPGYPSYGLYNQYDSTSVVLRGSSFSGRGGYAVPPVTQTKIYGIDRYVLSLDSAWGTARTETLQYDANYYTDDLHAEIAIAENPSAGVTVTIPGTTSKVYTAVASGTPTSSQFLIGSNNIFTAQNLAKQVEGNRSTEDVTAEAEGAVVKVKGYSMDRDIVPTTSDSTKIIISRVEAVDTMTTEWSGWCDEYLKGEYYDYLSGTTRVKLTDYIRGILARKAERTFAQVEKALAA